MTTNPSLLSPPSPRIATPANVAGLPDEGVATAFIVRLIPSLAVPTRMRLLVTSCGVNVPFPLAQACAVPGQAMAAARQVVRQPTVDIIDPPAPYEDADLLLAELDRHYVRGLDGIIFIHAAYTAGEIGAHLGRWLGEHALPVLSCPLAKRFWVYAGIWFAGSVHLEFPAGNQGQIPRTNRTRTGIDLTVI